MLAYQREAQREQFGELANQKRQEAIDQLKEILATQRLPPDTKAEMLMRLAELYFEQSKYEYNTEMQDYEKRYDKWFEDYELGPKAIIETDNLDYLHDLIDRVDLVEHIESLLEK